MDKREFLKFTGRAVRIVTLVVLGVLIITGLVCWFSGRRSFQDYGDSLMIGGVVVILLGFSSMMGSTRMAKDPTIHYIQSVSRADLHTRTRLNVQTLAESNAFLIIMTVAGAISIGLGELVKSCFKPQ